MDQPPGRAARVGEGCGWWGEKRHWIVGSGRGAALEGEWLGWRTKNPLPVNRPTSLGGWWAEVRVSKATRCRGMGG